MTRAEAIARTGYRTGWVVHAPSSSLCLRVATRAEARRVVSDAHRIGIAAYIVPLSPPEA